MSQSQQASPFLVFDQLGLRVPHGIRRLGAGELVDRRPDVAIFCQLGITTACLIFDGLAVVGDAGLAVKIAEGECERLCPGLGMQWVVKPHDFSVRDGRENVIGELRLNPEIPDGAKLKLKPRRVPTWILGAHNASYDFGVSLMKHLTRCQIVNRGHKMVCGSARFVLPSWLATDKVGKVVDIQFLDTYRMISLPLRDFAESFKLDCQKEVMPHKWFTRQNVARQFGRPEEWECYLSCDDAALMCARTSNLSGALLGTGRSICSSTRASTANRTSRSCGRAI